MSKADKIESVMLKIIGGGIAFYFVMALREAAKRKATEDYYANKSDGK